MSVHEIREALRRNANAQASLAELSDREKVNLALRELLGITDPDAGALLRFAANQLAAHGDKLLRVKFERECE